MITKNSRWVGLCALTVASCAGVKLNDVGDINNGGSGGGAGEAVVADGGADGRTVPAAGGEPGITPHGGKGWGGYGATGGSLQTVDPTYAGSEGILNGGAPDILPPEPVCVGCSTVASEAGDVRDLEVNDQKVFWVDYGSFDKLGNYQNDGRLVARPLAGGSPQVLASTLPGPVELELSNDYAYMLVDSLGGLEPNGLVRLPLAGGPLETLTKQATFTFGSISTTAGFTYVANGPAVLRIAETPGATPEVVFPNFNGTELIADAAGVYLFVDHEGRSDSEIDLMPPAGGEATLFHSITTGQGEPVALDANFLYFQEEPAGPCCDNSTYLARIDRSNGASKRLAKMDTAGSFALRQGRFFGNAVILNPRNGTDLAAHIFQGGLTSPDQVTDLVVDGPQSLRFMAPASVGVFFASKSVVRLAPLLP